MTSQEEASTAPDDDVKAKFREALERKKARSHRSAEGAEHQGSRHGPGTVGGQRMFRRKSG